mgnify:CR=1 FL=1
MGPDLVRIDPCGVKEALKTPRRANSGRKKIEKKFNKKVVTYVIKFDKFYEAENYHQDYYRKKFLNYLRYKKACGREKKLDSIWNK